MLRRGNSLTIKPQISFDGVDWNTDFSFMKKSTFIWISIFYALIMNALRHGWTEAFNKDEFSRVVNIEVKTDEKHIIITNKYVFHQNVNKRDGITLETVKAFFTHFGFKFEIVDPTEEEYIVKIPLEKE